MTEIPKNKEYKMLFELIKTFAPNFYESYNDEHRQFLKKATTVLSGEKQDNIIQCSRKDLELQLSIIHSDKIDKTHMQDFLNGFMYKQTKISLLKSRKIDGLENKDKIIQSTINDLGAKTLNTLFKKEPNSISPSVVNYIVKDVINQINDKGDDLSLEPYQTKVFSLYKNPVLNQQVFDTIQKHQISEDIISELMNNENISEHTRDSLQQENYNPSLLENPPFELLQTMYQDAVETLYELSETEKEKESNAIAEQFLIKMINANKLPESLQVDLMGRLLMENSFRYNGIPDPVLSALVTKTNSDTVLQFYASGALSKNKRFRKLLFENEYMPKDTIDTLMSIIVDGFKEHGELQKDEYEFFLKHIHDDKLHKNVYDGITEFKDSGSAEIYLNDTGFEQLKTICENVALSRHTPDAVKKELRFMYYGNIPEYVEFSKQCKIKEIDILDHFKVLEGNKSLFAGSSKYEFKLSTDFAYTDLYDKIKTALNITYKETDKDKYIHYKRGTRPQKDDTIVGLLNDLEKIKVESVFKIDVGVQEKMKLGDKIKSIPTLFDLYEQFDVLAEKTNEIKKLINTREEMQSEFVNKTEIETNER